MSLQAIGQLKFVITAIWDHTTEWHVGSTDASIVTDVLAHSHSLRRVPVIERLKISQYAHDPNIKATSPRFSCERKMIVGIHDNFRGDRYVNVSNANLVCNLRNLSNCRSKLARQCGDRIVPDLLKGDISDNISKFRGLVFKSEMLRYLYAISGAGGLFAVSPLIHHSQCQQNEWSTIGL